MGIVVHGKDAALTEAGRKEVQRLGYLNFRRLRFIIDLKRLRIESSTGTGAQCFESREGRETDGEETWILALEVSIP